ncbi:MAG TPA: Clp protease ClpP [Clostridia bacterium]|nr:Clp protease ClpP [Clostridia bacterium]
MFWRWVTNAANERKLEIDGDIASEAWFDGEVTPKQFREQLYAGDGPITLRINSPGGDVFAASEMYDMLLEYPGAVTVHIPSLAASAASFLAMAGAKVLVGATGTIMIHNPATIAWGEEKELKAGVNLLREVKENIINAYERKTKLSRNKLAAMMDAETWMGANKAIELGFADGILHEDTGQEPTTAKAAAGFLFDRRTNEQIVLNALRARLPKPAEPLSPAGFPLENFQRRLDLRNRL